MRILLAIDGSKQSESAVEEIAGRRLSVDSVVRVISVVESQNFPGAFLAEGVDTSFYQGLESIARERARVAVDKAVQIIRANEEGRRVKITTEILSGSPKHLILEDAEAFQADVILVGSHGQGRIERFLLGSVAQAVALHARCSVEIVRRRSAGEPMEAANG